MLALVVLVVIVAVFALIAFMGWVDAIGEPPEMDPWK
jgi:Tfp pilus assembly protein PilE